MKTDSESVRQTVSRGPHDHSGYRQQKIRTGSLDLKIASIAVAQNALLLTANTHDFEKIPGLKIEDWIN